MEKANTEAEEIASDSSRALELIKKVRSKMNRVGEDLAAMVDMVEMHYKKKYYMETCDLLIVMACLVYVASPMDAIPDATPIIGYTDDALVVRTTVNIVHDNLDRFKRWKQRNQGTYKQAKEDSCCDDCVVL